MKKLLLVVLFLATAGFLSAQEKSETSAVIDAAPSASKPATNPIVRNSIEAFGDVQYNYDLSTLTNLGNASAEFDGEFLWFGKWSPGGATNKVFRARTDGTLRDSFSVAGYTLASGIRDFAWDGRFMYGGAAGNAIVKIDTGSRAVVRTITISGVPTGVNVRGIAFDPVRNGFWICAFGGPIVCVDTNGVAIPGAQITNTLAGKYGLAYDDFTPGGPYLWAFDQSGTGQNATLYQFRLSDGQLVGTPFYVGSVITNAGANPLAGGLFVADGIVPGKATIGGVLQGTPDRLFGLELTTTALNALNPFNLVSPSAGVTVLTSAGNTTPVTISWDTSATGARYNWVFSIDSVSAPRLLTIPSNTNSLTLTLGQIDAALASLGLEPGQSQSGFWTVWAYKVAGAPGPDSLRATTWRDITFGRQGITLSAFNLLSPPDNTTLVTLPTNLNPLNIVWSKSGTGAVTYKWFFTAPSLTGSLPTAVFNSNNGGLDTVLTLRVSQIDSLLAGAGIVVGDSLTGEWRVFAYRSQTDSLSSTQTFNITLRRGIGFSYRVEVITQAGYDSLTTGTAVSLTGDDSFTTVPMPIPFEFAEVPYSNINICTNGFLNFGTGSTAFSNNLSATTAPFNVVAPFWDDLFFHPGSNVITDVQGTAPNRVFIVQFNNVGRYPSTSAWRLNFQTRFYETTNVIEFIYGGTTPGTETFTASIGLKGAVGGPGNFVDATTGSTTTANNSIAQFPARGLKYRLIPGQPGFSGTNTVRTVPKEFKLEQNYPNPFNPTTTIQFAVPSVSDVKLEVFNILGQKVSTLVNRRMKAGMHTVNFNAANLSSGVYFYRLQSGSFVQTKKMMLVK
jgi:hypothetical protein